MRWNEGKIINNLMDSNCPRLNNNAVVARRDLRHEDWPAVRIYPRVLKPGLSGFFQAQLRKIKSLNKKKKSKLSSINSVDNQIISKTSSSFPRHRNNNSKNNSLLSDLPQELLAQILVRLPVKYILRCRCVLKSWNYFIKSPVFITLHLNYHKQLITANHIYHYPKYLLFQFLHDFGLTLRLDQVQCEEYCRLDFLPHYPGLAWFALSYGLICTSTLFLAGPEYNRNIYLWNPLINKYKIVPTSPFASSPKWSAWEALAFGFLPQVDDYVVIHITKPCLPPHPHIVNIGVYSFKSNSWKKSSQDNVFISGISNRQDNVVFVNGAAFWLGVNSNKQRILMCFDTKTDILSEISLPDSVKYLPSVPVIHAFGQSIAYFIWEKGLVHFDMWVLKYDYTSEFTWEKKMCVTPTPSGNVREEVLGLRNNGEPILAKSKHLISYDLDSHRAKGFVKSWDRWNPEYQDIGSPYIIRPFVESLVMLNDD